MADATNPYPSGMVETPPGMFPRMPDQVFPAVLAKSVTPEVRQAASQWLDTVLGKNSQGGVDPYGAGEPPTDTNHTLDLAHQLLLRANPAALDKINTLRVGKLPDGINGAFSPWQRAIRISPDLSYNVETLMDTLRHEASHSRGMEDNGSPNAYEVGDASRVLHKDIQLPHERKR